MDKIYIDHIARKLGVRDWQVENCINLLSEGNTVPFISRYRKEKTGGLDDAGVAEIKHWADVFIEMGKRKETILETISGLGKLTPELKSAIDNCVVASELEDLYLPYRPNRRTRAAIAKEAGLEPLADKIYSVSLSNPLHEASKYINDKVKTVEDAISGACDIIVERLSETVSVRDTVRQIFRTRHIESSMTKAAKESEDAAKYRSYFDFSIPLAKIPSHNLLAILRGQNEGFLNVKIDADSEKCCNKLYYDFCKERRFPSDDLAKIIRRAVDDAYLRLIAPSITGEIIKEAKEKADKDSINVFGENLRQLLLSAPFGQKRTMAVDPGFRNGCKIVCLDEYGNLLHNEIIYPHPPQNDKIKAMESVSAMVAKYSIEVIAVGNGTASRETEDFLRRIGLSDAVKIFIVSEDGASIYSASDVAREEFPNEDVTVRGAASIGRRLMDPLAELVKIDPKSLGIGQYQHDVDQALLKEKLDNTVVSCVNSVGVNLNTASPYLLSYVSGIGPVLANNIISYRLENGGFTSREELKKVPRLGDKAYQQCAGFLRIKDALNPLDASAVHPECYHIVEKMAKGLGVSSKDLVGNSALCSKIKAEDYVEGDFGLPTINDIIKELAKPGLDPREEAKEFSFAADIHEIEDLKPGMELSGIITNITNFGAFVNIGIHQNGLIHISQINGKTLKLHGQVKVIVLSVDIERKRISLRLQS